MTARVRGGLVAVVAAAAALRFVGLDWDGGHAVHPDERRISFALEELSFRPLRLNPHFFAYGSFPLYVQKAWAAAAARAGLGSDDFHGRILLGRVLSASVGTLSVAWLFLLGRRLYGERAALLAAALLALAVLPIQHSHFVTVDLWQAALALGALERLVAFHREGRPQALASAAVLAGLALATKASSAPILLSLLAAPFLRPADEAPLRWARRGGAAAAALAISAAAFALGEPYAFLDSEAFLRDLREQARIVREAGIVPYTIQYVGTRPVVDDLRQAFVWGTGPALGAAAALGTLGALARAVRSPRGAETPILLFLVPYFALSASFPVKFMRYLLPLYPPWCLFAARLLAGQGEDSARRDRRFAAAAVVAATGAYALAFATIYLRPHPWVEASRWFYREFPAGSAVLVPHWEEGFPLAVDGFSPGRYRRLELALYDPDTADKVRALAERLARGDALVFPSKRLYGAISNVPGRFPRTVRFLELLFAGDLGYRLERVFASRPRLFGIELDDDFADESFSVYDHPKTLVFRNVGRLPAGELERRLDTASPSRPVSRDAMLAAGSEILPGTPAAAGFVESSAAGACLWAGALAALSASGGRLLAAALPGVAPPASAGLGRVAGLLLFAYPPWLAASLGMAPFSFPTLLVSAALLVALARRLPAPERGSAERIVFYGAFAFFLLARAFQPEIYWGEKPMDFSFLNSLYRTISLPPPEPWMSGRTINYPYFGHFGVAALGKLACVSPALAFNLGIATTGALTAAAAFGLGTLLSGGTAGGVASAVLVAFAGNLSGLPELLRRGTVDFHTFWATSRVIENTINEFPLWSFLFADLHAHVLAMPLSLLFTALAARIAAGRASASLLALASLVLGAVATTSTWSLPVQAGAAAGLGLLFALRRRTPGPLAAAASTIALSPLWFLPYWSGFVAPPRHAGFESQGAPVLGVLLVFGGFLAAALLAFLDLARERGWLRPALRGLFVLLVVLSGVVSARALFLVVALGSLAAAVAESDDGRAVAFGLAGGAALLGAAADTVFFWDRMNTVFKLYLEAWLWFGVACGALLATGGRRLLRGAPSAAVLAVAASLSGATAAVDTIAAFRTRHAEGPRPTLDGQAYLARIRPDEAEAIRWLQRNVPGSPVLLEAQGPPYREFSRISMNTGLPTVLGWEYHLSQRAHPWTEIRRRADAVARLYRGADRDEIAKLLREYGVSLVYVGDIERREYGTGTETFDRWRDLFRPVFRNRSVAIYAVAPGSASASLSLEPPARPETEAAPLGIFSQPRGLARDPRGNLWVVDFGHDRVQILGPSLEPKRSFGRSGSGPGEFRDPCGIAIGPDRAYVADTWNHRVQVFDLDAAFLAEWRDEFYGPRGVAVAPDGSVYVADTGNGRLVRFSREGSVRERIGRKGAGRGEFSEPVGIAVASDGRVYVADSGNRRIVVLSPDGQWQEAWPVRGFAPGPYREPYLALLPGERLAASDPTANRILLLDSAGRILRVHGFARRTVPTGIAWAGGERLVASGLETNRVEILSLPPGEAGSLERPEAAGRATVR